MKIRGELMKNTELIELDYQSRIEEILNLSWKILKSKFIMGDIIMMKEAPFQHHFSNIISSVGNLFCVSREDAWKVDLEKKCILNPEKYSFIDITCMFENVNVKCAIELKFKTAKQAAQDYGRIDSYIDIKSLEKACSNEYQLGKFYMITNSSAYINKSKRGVGTVFSMHDGFKSEASKILNYPCKGRENVEIALTNAYEFHWEKNNDWYFLDLSISP